MILELEELNNERNITRQELLELLKFEALKIHINDIIKACNYLKEEGKYVQPIYREKFYESYIKSFILRVKEIKEDRNVYNDPVNMDELKNSLKLLKDQEITMREIYPY